MENWILRGFLLCIGDEAIDIAYNYLLILRHKRTFIHTDWPKSTIYSFASALELVMKSYINQLVLVAYIFFYLSLIPFCFCFAESDCMKFKWIMFMFNETGTLVCICTLITFAHSLSPPLAFHEAPTNRLLSVKLKFARFRAN